MWDIKKLKNHLACVTIIAKKSPGKKKCIFPVIALVRTRMSSKKKTVD